MNKGLRKLKISWLWLPYLLLSRMIPMQKIVFYIFLILTIHELAHIFIARLFHYPIEKVILYPFGLAAQIAYIGYGNLLQEALILIVGPFTHVIMPIGLAFLCHQGILSLPFYSYLLQINAALLVFNLLPIYPLDGGRLLQTFFHCFLPFKLANKATYLVSFLGLLIFAESSLCQGISMWMLCVCFFIQLFLAWRQLPYAALQFYHYRLLHPTSYPPLFHEHQDLYRGRYNILKCQKGWLKEEAWLKAHFFTNKSRR